MKAVTGSRHDDDKPAVRSKRLPQRPGIVWSVGSRIEAMDQINKWYSAKIVDLDENDMTILVHFDGWNQRFDEWIKMDSPRIRSFTKQSDSVKSDKQTFKAGDNVLAQWSDSRMYPAKILGLSSTGSYDVLFFDGLRKTLRHQRIQPMPRDVEKKYTDAGILGVHSQLQCPTKTKQEKESSPPDVKTSAADVLSRRNSSAAKQFPGSTVAAALRRKATSFESSPCQLAGKQQSVVVDPMECMAFIDDQQSSSSAAATYTRSGRIRSSDGPDSIKTPSEHGQIKRRRMVSVPSSSDSQSSVVMDTVGIGPGAKNTSESTKPVEVLVPFVTADSTLSATNAPSSIESLQSASINTKAPDTDLSSNRDLSTESCLHDSKDVEVKQPFVHIDASETDRLNVGGARCQMSMKPKRAQRIASAQQSLSSATVFKTADIVSDTDGAQFKCNSCGKSFRKQSLLDYHIKYHHSDSSGKPSVSSTRRSRYRSLPLVSEISTSASPGSRFHSPLTVKRRHSSTALTSSSSSSSLTPLLTRLRSRSKSRLSSTQLSAERLMEDELEESASEAVTDSSINSATGLETEDIKIIVCTCQEAENASELIQCSVCLCYQHISCLNTSCLKPFEKHVCGTCRDPKGIRDSARYSYAHDWLNTGRMAEFSLLGQEPNIAAKAKIMKATHDLVADVLGVASVVGSLNREIDVLQKKTEPEFGKWKHSGSDSGCKLSAEVEDIKINQAAVDSSKSTDIILAMASESACAPGDVEMELGGLDRPLSHASADQQNKGAVNTDNISECAHPPKLPDAVSDAKISETGNAESYGNCNESYKPDSAEQGFVAVDALRQKQPLSNATVDSEHDVDQKRSVYEQICESNLLDHIMKTQACVEERLDLLERQVAALEEDEGNGGNSSGDPLRDLNRVRKTVHQLINCLDKVNQLSVCST